MRHYSGNLGCLEALLYYALAKALDLDWLFRSAAACCKTLLSFHLCPSALSSGSLREAPHSPLPVWLVLLHRSTDHWSTLRESSCGGRSSSFTLCAHPFIDFSFFLSRVLDLFRSTALPPEECIAVHSARVEG